MLHDRTALLGDPDPLGQESADQFPVMSSWLFPYNLHNAQKYQPDVGQFLPHAADKIVIFIYTSFIQIDDRRIGRYCGDAGMISK